MSYQISLPKPILVLKHSSESLLLKSFFPGLCSKVLRGCFFGGQFDFSLCDPVCLNDRYFITLMNTVRESKGYPEKNV